MSCGRQDIRGIDEIKSGLSSWHVDIISNWTKLDHFQVGLVLSSTFFKNGLQNGLRKEVSLKLSETK